jgi:hypothetical protein
MRCKIVACREALDDGNEWSFYLINDSAFALDLAVLHEIQYEWGDIGNSQTTDVRVANLATEAQALIWRDDGSGAELRMDFLLRVCARGCEAELRFEFPKLYLKRNLDQIAALGKPGYEVVAEQMLPITK